MSSLESSSESEPEEKPRRSREQNLRKRENSLDSKGSHHIAGSKSTRRHAAKSSERSHQFALLSDCLREYGHSKDQSSVAMMVEATSHDSHKHLAFSPKTETAERETEIQTLQPFHSFPEELKESRFGAHGRIESKDSSDMVRIHQSAHFNAQSFGKKAFVTRGSKEQLIEEYNSHDPPTIVSNS